MKDFCRKKGRITDNGYSLHCNVSMVSAAFVVGGIGAAAATVAGLGAATMAAGSVLGIKEAKPIGGLMMAGGGMVAGGSGLMAGGLGTLGTLSAGAQLVGGALQGVGILTGNDKMSGIGGLINGAGMVGSSFDKAGISSANSSANAADQQANYSIASASNAPSSGGLSGIKVPGTPGINQAGGIVPSAGSENIFDRIQKYDKLIKMAGDFSAGSAQNSAKQDELALKQRELDLMNRRSTAVAIPGSLPVSTGAPQAVAPIVANRSTGLLNTTSKQVPGVA